MATAVKTAYAHVTKEPGVCGGKAAIDDTRVRVADVVCLHQQGMSPQEILVRYPQLSLGQVHAALAYYYDHRDEIEATLRAEETAEEDHERAKAEYLSRQQGR